MCFSLTHPSPLLPVFHKRTNIFVEITNIMLVWVDVLVMRGSPAVDQLFASEGGEEMVLCHSLLITTMKGHYRNITMSFCVRGDLNLQNKNSHHITTSYCSPRIVSRVLLFIRMLSRHTPLSPSEQKQLF